jgi:hypothetical protein
MLPPGGLHSLLSFGMVAGLPFDGALFWLSHWQSDVSNSWLSMVRVGHHLPGTDWWCSTLTATV